VARSPFTVGSSRSAVRCPRPAGNGGPATGFTLVESLAALAVASIALLALLQLQLVSLRTADKARVMTQAVLLAQEKQAEILGTGLPPLGTQSGMAQTDGAELAWRTDVADERGALGGRLRRLSVEVTWQKGPGNRRICLTTYVAENRIREG